MRRETNPDEHVGVPEPLLFLWHVFGRLDERLDEQRILRDSGCDEEDALGNAFLLQQRVVGTLSDKMLESPIGLEQFLVHGHGLAVLAAKGAVSVLPELTLFT